MMRVLNVTWYKVLPPVFGGQKGIAFFANSMADHVHLTFLCSKDNHPSDRSPYTVLPLLPIGKTQFIDPRSWLTIIRTIRKEQITHLLLEHPYYGWAGVWARKKTGVKLIIHSHNIESERFREQQRKGWRLLAAYEKWVHRKADLTLFKTPEDMQFALQRFELSPSACMVVPYGIERPSLPTKETCQRIIREKYGIGPKEIIFLFAGTLDYLPNAKAVCNIYGEIAPRLLASGHNYRIIICGRNRHKTYRYLKNLRHPLVIDAGEVEDISIYFGAADTFINPVQQGGGVQTKIMDAIAHQCNVVCFSSMAASIPGYLSGEKLFAANDNDWEQFAQLALASASLQKETPPRFYDDFSWAAIAESTVTRLRQL